MGRTIEQTLGYLFGLQRFEENPKLDATIQETLQRYPSLRSDGKVRKNEMRPTRQDEHIMPGPEQSTKSHDEQIEEIRKNTQDTKHLDVWEREAARAIEQAKTGSDAEVTDCFARHLYAQSIVASADRANRLPYYKNIFDKSVEELKENKSFKLMVKTYGVKGMREALSAPNPQAASMELFAPQQGKRYAVNDTIRKELRALSADMQTKGRSEEWQKLHDALSDPGMKDASRVFDAVEAYTKGKKSVRMTQQGRESFNLAMTALAIAAKIGDPAARQRAQNLVDRINEVRGSADPKHKDHVSLQGYEPKDLDEKLRKAEEREAQEAKLDAERLAKDAQDPTRAEKNQQFLNWLDKQVIITQVDRARADLYLINHPGVREEAHRISEKRDLNLTIPKIRQQPEKQQQKPEKQEPVKAQPEELGAGI